LVGLLQATDEMKCRRSTQVTRSNCVNVRDRRLELLPILLLTKLAARQLYREPTQREAALSGREPYAA